MPDHKLARHKKDRLIAIFLLKNYYELQSTSFTTTLEKTQGESLVYDIKSVLVGKRCQAKEARKQA